MVDPTAMAWSMEDWQWDPFTLKAMPAEKASGKPQRTGAPAPELAPSLDLSSVSTQLVEEAHQAAGKGKGRPQCQVEGCSGDLTALKEYHQRYKICEYHLKARSAPPHAPPGRPARGAATAAQPGFSPLLTGGWARRAGEQHRVRRAPAALLPAVRALP